MIHIKQNFKENYMAADGKDATFQAEVVFDELAKLIANNTANVVAALIASGVKVPQKKLTKRKLVKIVYDNLDNKVFTQKVAQLIVINNAAESYMNASDVIFYDGGGDAAKAGQSVKTGVGGQLPSPKKEAAKNKAFGAAIANLLSNPQFTQSVGNILSNVKIGNSKVSDQQNADYEKKLAEKVAAYDVAPQSNAGKIALIAGGIILSLGIGIFLYRKYAK
jgi:hypothetical protein